MAEELKELGVQFGRRQIGRLMRPNGISVSTKRCLSRKQRGNALRELGANQIKLILTNWDYLNWI